MLAIRPETTTDFMNRLQSPIEAQFSIREIPGFPYEEYQKNQTRYKEMLSWYDGTKLDETIQQAGKSTDKYPVKVNPLQSTVEKHTHFLFGEVEQDDRPLVNARVVSTQKSEKEAALHAEDVLAQAWWESNGRAIQWENGATSQIYGGCIFHIAYDPFDPLRTLPIRIERIHPSEIVVRPMSNDMWRLADAWIVKPISYDEAIENGYTPGDNEPTWLVIHYTDMVYDVSINGKPATRFVDGMWQPLSGPNRWGFIPIVYIPHIRTTGFYGTNVIDVAKGLIKEFNLRLADYGDAVTVDAHSYLGMRNVSGAPTVQQVAPGRFAINLGNSVGITGNEANPDLFDLGKPSASSPMHELSILLYNIYRRLVYIPAVVDGEDEGSQRSGLTLAMRMISLTAHTDSERVFWTTGLIVLDRMILKMLNILGAGQVSAKHLVLRIKQEWAPVLPRDREMVVTEATSLMAAKLGSPERLLEVLGVDDTEKEKQLILDFWEEITKITQPAFPNVANQQGNGAEPVNKGQAGSSTEAAKGTPAREKKQQ